MEHDNKPRWVVKLERATSRKDKRRTRQKTHRLECILYRGEHLKAPLVKFKLLASIQSDKLKDVETRRLFWSTTLRQLGDLPADLMGSETEVALLRKILRWVKYDRPAPQALPTLPSGAFLRLRQTLASSPIQPLPNPPPILSPSWVKRVLGSDATPFLNRNSYLKAALERLAAEEK
jgi:hypothetical protein